jgi:hypothetical protein
MGIMERNREICKTRPLSRLRRFWEPLGWPAGRSGPMANRCTGSPQPLCMSHGPRPGRARQDENPKEAT